jgi:hypothetical protein
MQERSRVVGMAFAACAALAAAFTTELSVRGDEVTLTPLKDNTLIETTNGPMSNALGDGIYSGRTFFFGQFTRRRAVLAFDVAAAIPAGSVIDAVTLDLFLIQSNSVSDTHTLHRLLADWGEGTSASPGGSGSAATSGDATWLHTFFPDQFWVTAGGDFAASPSASLTVTNEVSTFTWGSTPEMVADVQGWLDDANSNFGWLLLGNEAGTQTARKFGSKEHVFPDWWPRLHIQFTPPCSLPADINCDGVVDETDRDLFVGVLLGTNTDPDHIARSDLNDDGDANGDDIQPFVAALLGF